MLCILNVARRLTDATLCPPAANAKKETEDLVIVETSPSESVHVVSEAKRDEAWTEVQQSSRVKVNESKVRLYLSKVNRRNSTGVQFATCHVFVNRCSIMECLSQGLSAYRYASNQVSCGW